MRAKMVASSTLTRRSAPHPLPKWPVRRLRTISPNLFPTHCHPILNLLFQDIQWDGAVAQDNIVELAHIKTRAELLLGVRPQLANFQLAHLVAEGLAGPNDVAVDFND